MNDTKTMPQAKIKKKIKARTIILIVIGALVLGFAGYIVYQRYFSKEKNNIFSTPKVKDSRIVNDLDGTKVDPEKAKRHPLAIMVENHPDARPQVGLDKASIVYEAVTEGGITRFMAVYGPYDATKVGPIRSARTYFIDWVSEFKAFYGHCGGNLDALNKIKTDNILDLDQFSIGDAAYWREPQKGIAIEHTMFTSTDKLYQVALNDKKWANTSEYKALKFKTPLEKALREVNQTIRIDFSSESYKVQWQYDPETNKYLRSMADKPHVDGLSNEQLATSNVIIQQMERWEAPTEINEQGWAMKTIGSDKAMIFSQGKQITGTWKKLDRSSRTLFYDDQGKEISFIPGQFWIEIVPPDVYSTIKIEMSELVPSSGTGTVNQ